jgi:hypothetical protein
MKNQLACNRACCCLNPTTTSANRASSPVLSCNPQSPCTSSAESVHKNPALAARASAARIHTSRRFNVSNSSPGARLLDPTPRAEIALPARTCPPNPLTSLGDPAAAAAAPNESAGDPLRLPPPDCPRNATAAIFTGDMPRSASVGERARSCGVRVRSTWSCGARASGGDRARSSWSWAWFGGDRVRSSAGSSSDLLGGLGGGTPVVLSLGGVAAVATAPNGCTCPALVPFGDRTRPDPGAADGDAPANRRASSGLGVALRASSSCTRLTSSGTPCACLHVGSSTLCAARRVSSGILRGSSTLCAPRRGSSGEARSADAAAGGLGPSPRWAPSVMFWPRGTPSTLPCPRLISCGDPPFVLEAPGGGVPFAPFDPGDSAPFGRRTVWFGGAALLSGYLIRSEHRAGQSRRNASGYGNAMNVHDKSQSAPIMTPGAQHIQKISSPTNRKFNQADQEKLTRIQDMHHH